MTISAYAMEDARQMVRRPNDLPPWPNVPLMAGGGPLAPGRGVGFGPEAAASLQQPINPLNTTVNQDPFTGRITDPMQPRDPQALADLWAPFTPNSAMGRSEVMAPDSEPKSLIRAFARSKFHPFYATIVFWAKPAGVTNTLKGFNFSGTIVIRRGVEGTQAPEINIDLGSGILLANQSGVTYGAALGGPNTAQVGACGGAISLPGFYFELIARNNAASLDTGLFGADISYAGVRGGAPSYLTQQLLSVLAGTSVAVAVPPYASALRLLRAPTAATALDLQFLDSASNIIVDMTIPAGTQMDETPLPNNTAVIQTTNNGPGTANISEMFRLAF